MKKVIALALALVLLFAMTGCGTAPEETTAPTPPQKKPTATVPETAAPTTEPQISLEEFKLLVARNVLAIHDSRLILIDVATYMGNYWGSLDRIGSAMGIQGMFENVMENIKEDGISSEAEIRTQYEANGALYKEVMFTEIDSAEADAIKEAFEDFYNLYVELYYLIMQPSGDSISFQESALSCVREMNQSMDRLAILLK